MNPKAYAWKVRGKQCHVGDQWGIFVACKGYEHTYDVPLDSLNNNN